MDLSRLACKILERVRDFRSNFKWTEPKTATPPKAKRAAAKVYHKQPTKHAKAAKPSKPSNKTKTSKTKQARGRATVKK